MAGDKPTTVHSILKFWEKDVPTILITGANWGLGLEWTRQLLEAGWGAIATCRHPEAAGELQRLAGSGPGHRGLPGQRGPQPTEIGGGHHQPHGSIPEIGAPGAYAYRAGKASLNAVMKGLSLELKVRGIGVLLLHPGWLQTRMGGPDAPLNPGRSLAGMRELVEGFSLDRTGSFLHYNGSIIPW